MEAFTVHCEYPVLYRCEVTVQAEDAVTACRAAIDSANQSDSWRGLDWEQPTYVVALVKGDNLDPWRRTPERAVESPLPVPGLFTEVASVAGYAATHSEDLVLQLRVMIDAIDDDGRSRVDPEAMVRLCATGRAMLDDIDRCGLPVKRSPDGKGEHGPG